MYSLNILLTQQHAVSIDACVSGYGCAQADKYTNTDGNREMELSFYVGWIIPVNINAD